MPYTCTRSAGPGVQHRAADDPAAVPGLPGVAEAYSATREYLLGRTCWSRRSPRPGNVATTRRVWFPPGRWTDFFTGATFTGPATADGDRAADRMPVFVRAGGIVPQAPGLPRVDPSPTALQLTVASGTEPSSFTLHQDAGEGRGYAEGQFTDTVLAYSARPGHWWRRASSRIAIGAATGSYPGAAAARSYTVDLLAVGRPHAVSVDGAALAEVEPQAGGPGWWYDPAGATLHVRTAALATAAPHRIEQRGGKVLDRP